MRRILAICVILLLAAAVVCAGQAPVRGKRAPRGGGVGPQWWPGEGSGGPGGGNVVRGIVAQVDAKSITLENKHGTFLFVVTDQTKVVVRGEPAKITDVKKGDPAAVRFQLALDGTRVAIGVMVPKPPQPAYAGRITAISEGSFTLSNRQTTWNVVVGTATKYESHGYVGAFADLRVGYGAKVNGELKGKDILAAAVHFQPTVLKGVIDSVSGNQVTFKTLRGDVVQAAVSGATAIWVRPRIGPNRRGTLADVKPNTAANIGGHVNVEAKTMQALWIDLLVATDTGGQGPAPGVRPGRRLRPGR